MTAHASSAGKQLWLVRHAKAAKDSSDGSDHSRRLTKRGRAQSEDARKFLKKALSERATKPGLVLSSSAARALETAQILLPGLGPGAKLAVESDLYRADPDDLISRLRGLEDDVASVMVVGHNPTIADLAHLLLYDGALDSDPRLAAVPTCAILQIGLEARSWSEVEEHRGVLGDYFVPDV